MTAHIETAAMIFHANYAPSLSAVKRDPPRWFIIKGTSAPGRRGSVGTGRGDYSLLWQTITVAWKPGVTPVLLTSDNTTIQPRRAADGTTTSQVVNATVVSVESSPDAIPVA